MKQPIADAMPPSAPVTSATVLAEARQSSAIAAKRFAAAPVPIGRKQTRSERNPPRERATLHRSRSTPRTLRATVSPRGVGGGSGMKASAPQQASEATASTTAASHG